MLDVYLTYLVDEIYKVLTSYESDRGGDKYRAYLDSLSSDMVGALKTFAELQTNKHYIKATNILNYLTMHSVSHYQCRRLTFEMIAAIDLAKIDCGGGAND